ncbi:hypothetical protein CR513_46242, partial [Mucuna pruriens]
MIGSSYSSNTTNFFSFTKIDRTFHRLIRSPKSSEVANSRLNSSVIVFDPANSADFDSNIANSDSNFGEDPHKHINEFHVVCSTMRPHGILEDYIKMKTFPFFLDGASKDWLYMQQVMFNTWGDMKRMFLRKFFPVSITTLIRKEICGRQHSGETLYKYWERFNNLCATCPHHQMSEQLLIQFFYEGLMLMDRSMIDAANGGVLMDKTSTVARNLISNMASDTQQFGVKDWLYMQQFFPVSITTLIGKEICGRQHNGETLYKYWERFNNLCATYPHHQMSEQLLIQFFYEGLMLMDRSMIDAANGGTLMDKTSTVARNLIFNMASDTQQFGVREHSTDAFLTLHEIEPNSAEVVAIMGDQQYRQPHDQYSNLRY